MLDSLMQIDARNRAECAFDRFSRQFVIRLRQQVFVVPTKHKLNVHTINANLLASLDRIYWHTADTLLTGFVSFLSLEKNYFVELYYYQT